MSKGSRRKVCRSIEDAIKRSGLQDGGTISFHHGFREGDRVLLQVVSELARLGFRDLTLASSSLANCHAGLVEYIGKGVITKIYSSGMRGELAQKISRGLLAEPIQIHSHGGRCALIQSGELHIDVAFLGVPTTDLMGNANGISGKAMCGPLGYAKVDAEHADCVVLVTEEIVDYPNQPASLRQDQVDLVVQVETIGDPARISAGATRVTKDPRELLIAQRAVQVIGHSGLLVDGFSLQTGSGGSSIATVNHLRKLMEASGVKMGWNLGGATGAMVDLYHAGLVGKILDVQAFDAKAIADLAVNPNHYEISASEYANPLGKGACVDELDVVILSALEIDLNFNVNVLTGSDGVMLGASGGHCDTAAGAKLAVVVAPLLRSRTPTVVEHLTTKVTPGSGIGVLVTDVGIAVNPSRPELAQRLLDAGHRLVPIEEQLARAQAIAGKPADPEVGDRVVGVVRYRDGSVLDTVHQVLH